MSANLKYAYLSRKTHLYGALVLFNHLAVLALRPMQTHVSNGSTDALLFMGISLDLLRSLFYFLLTIGLFYILFTFLKLKHFPTRHAPKVKKLEKKILRNNLVAIIIFCAIHIIARIALYFV